MASTLGAIAGTSAAMKYSLCPRPTTTGRPPRVATLIIRITAGDRANREATPDLFQRGSQRALEIAV